ncbi:MAG: hypothetical protein M3Q17_04740 [Actinomycetota bacterium]|nr:hypothetical protein [Actinomycetota bacterium]
MSCAQGAVIFDLAFRIVAQYRPFELVAPRFVQLDQVPDARVTSLRATSESPPAPFAAVELDVTALDAGGVAAGLATADGSHVVAGYDPVRSRATVEVRRDGRSFVVARRRARLNAPFRFAFVLCENQVTALADTGDGWHPLVTSRKAVAHLVDLREPDALAEHGFCFGTRRPRGEVGVERVRAGSFGMVGVRDPHLVQHPDGSPYIKSGKLYLTLTCAGLGAFTQAHWGVFTLDLHDLTRLEQVAQLYAVRDGLVLGDHAGQVVVDEEAGRFDVVNTAWGDFDGDGVHVRHASTTDNVLSGVHRLETRRLALPTPASAWDPALTCIDDRWYVGFAESPSQTPFDMHPALAVGVPGGDYGTALRKVGADESVHQCEGAVLQRIEGQWYLLASDGHLREYRVYDLSMRLVGRLDAPYVSNIPHPQVVNLPSGEMLLITFDGSPYGERALGYGTHGDLVVMSTRSGSAVEQTIAHPI